jgi:AraC-like DNA-binding protein
MDLFRLPLPFVSVALMALLAARLARAEGLERVAQRLFIALAALCMVRAVLVGLRFGYGLEAVIPIQRLLPLTLGPLAYLGFRRVTDPGFAVGPGLVRHGGLVLLLLAFCLSMPQGIRWVDFMMLISLGGYGAALGRLYRRGPDGWPGLGFTAAEPIRLALRLMLLLLIGEGVLDSLIALDFLWAEGRHVPTLISVGNLLLIAALGWMLLRRPAPIAPPAPSPLPEVAADHEQLLADLDRLLADPALYGDPDLTLARLAKRLHVPARRVSEAVNRQHGMNVSHYVNRARLLAAADLLRSSDLAIAEVMTRCGFRSKSNFNRECHRVFGCAPSDVRAGA